MPKSQRREIRPPTKEDRDLLTDYSAAIQYSFTDLFQAAHDHVIRATDPTDNDGFKQQIAIVDNGTNVYLVVKTSRGWFKSPNFTAI